MSEYLVTWQIDIEASNPKEAAELALEIMRDPESIATMFEVIDSDTGVGTVIDLTYGNKN